MKLIAFNLRHTILRARIQVDQWDNVEKGRGPDLEDLRERAETLIDIMREVARLRLPQKEAP